MSYWKPLAGTLGLAVLLAWFLAMPNIATETSNPGDGLTLPATPDRLTANEAQTLLQRIYERELWSAAAPETPDATDPEGSAKTDTPPPPEGLDRFTLVGIFRVEGRLPEALLIDGKALTMDEVATFTAREGETLRDTDVLLDRIDPTRVRLSIPDADRWLYLFRPADSFRSQRTTTINHENAFSD